MEIQHLPSLWFPPRTPPACVPSLFVLPPLCWCGTYAFRPLVPLLPTLCFLPLHPRHRLMLLAVLLHPLHPLTPSGFFRGVLELSKPGALNFHTFFCLIPFTLSVSGNLASINLSLSGSLGSLLCDLVVPAPGLALSLLMSRTLAAMSSCLSGRACPSRSILPPLFLCWTPALIVWGSASHWMAPLCSHSLMFVFPLFALLRWMEPTPLLPLFFLPPDVSSFWGSSIAIAPSGTWRVLLTPVGRFLVESSLLTSFPLVTLVCLLYFVAAPMTSFLFSPLSLLKGARVPGF